MLVRALGSVALLAVGLPATMAFAAPPDPVRSVVEPILVGSSGVSIGGGFVVVVRDATGAPCPEVVVSCDFSGTPTHLQTTQTAGTAVECSAETITKLTDASGLAVFDIRFGGFVNAPDVDIFAAGIPLASVPARSTDMNGIGGTNLQDLSLFRSAFFDKAYNPEIDFGGGPGGNPDGLDNLSDFSIFIRAFFGSQSSAYCP